MSVEDLHTEFESVHNWCSLRGEISLVFDEPHIRVWELSKEEVLRFIERRKKALEQLESLKLYSTPIWFIDIARDSLQTLFYVDASSVPPEKVGYLYLRALEKDALFAAEFRLTELQRREALLQFDDDHHPHSGGLLVGLNLELSSQ